MGQTLGGGITQSKFSHTDDSGYKDPDLNETTSHMNMFLGINFPEKYIKFFDFECGFSECIKYVKDNFGSGYLNLAEITQEFLISNKIIQTFINFFLFLNKY